MGRRRNGDAAASALHYGPKSDLVETHPAMDTPAPGDDDPDPNGDWTDEDWERFDERNS